MFDKIKKVFMEESDFVLRKFYELLNEEKFMTVQCKRCGKILFPPRALCTNCLSEEFEWTPLSGKGKIYAFMQQDRAIAFMKPEVIGVVELDDIEDSRLLTKIEGKFEDLKIGMEVQIAYQKMGNEYTIHKFVPSK